MSTTLTDGPAARSIASLGDLQLVVARSPRQRRQVRTFRQRTYRERSALALDDERAIDLRSYVMALHQRGELVACVRVLPLPDPSAGIIEFDHPPFTIAPASTEVGRLAVARGRSPLLLLGILGLGARWMIDHTEHEDYVAYCNAKLVPLYVRVGARDLGIELARPGTARTYRFVRGRFVDAADAAMALLAELIGPDETMALTA